MVCCERRFQWGCFRRNLSKNCCLSPFEIEFGMLLLGFDLIRFTSLCCQGTDRLKAKKSVFGGKTGGARTVLGPTVIIRLSLASSWTNSHRNRKSHAAAG
jgi:hypothetical protein